MRLDDVQTDRAMWTTTAVRAIWLGCILGLGCSGSDPDRRQGDATVGGTDGTSQQDTRIVEDAPLDVSVSMDVARPGPGDARGDTCRPFGGALDYPTRVVFVVDISDSMLVSDPHEGSAEACRWGCSETLGPSEPAIAQCDALCSGPAVPARQAAVRDVIDRMQGRPDTAFAVVSFNLEVVVNGGAAGAGFTADPDVLSQAADSLGQAQGFTDYHGVLSETLALIERDIQQESDAERRARTKVVVVFVADGAPYPICRLGCDNDPISAATPMRGWCDVPRDRWCDHFGGLQCGDMQHWFPALTVECGEYNATHQILGLVDAIAALARPQGVGEVVLHTIGLSPELPAEIRAALRLTDEEDTLLRQMAAAGYGSYRSIDASTPSLSHIDFDSLAPACDR